jgi:formylglycine-generating enzyme required for sulfatase activity
VNRKAKVIESALYIAIIFFVTSCPLPTTSVTVKPIIPTMISIPGGTFNNGTSNIAISNMHMSK